MRRAFQELKGDILVVPGRLGGGKGYLLERTRTLSTNLLMRD